LAALSPCGVATLHTSWYGGVAASDFDGSADGEATAVVVVVVVVVVAAANASPGTSSLNSP
jgi:hypothetical protein